MKIKTIYTCNECKYESPKWMGQCPSCQSWDGFSETTISKTPRLNTQISQKIAPRELQSLKVSKSSNISRLQTGINELDRTLGGGFTAASATLLGGEPGIGKSTLTVQLADKISAKGKKLIYVSGEESLNQVAGRAERLKLNTAKISFLQENNLESVLSTIEVEKPEFLIIDSIQTLTSLDSTSAPGSVSQTILVTERLIEHCKKQNITLLLIGHVTKEGNLAGPKMIEHLVDTVLLLEGDRHHQYRMLRTSKNRFGSTNEIGIFQMQENGLAEVSNPAMAFLEGRNEQAIGSILTVSMEGNRPLLIEIQALTNKTAFGYPKRTSHGFDLTRLHILAAVLQKHAKLKLNEQDIFINIVGGFKIKDPALDLAVAMAICSSYYKQPMGSVAVLGELGLSGEVRAISKPNLRLKELSKLGIKKVILPFHSEKYQNHKLQLNEVKSMKQIIEKTFT